jgi:hypothetical protein
MIYARSNIIILETVTEGKIQPMIYHDKTVQNKLYSVTKKIVPRKSIMLGNVMAMQHHDDSLREDLIVIFRA